jgi:hypothetical protein
MQPRFYKAVFNIRKEDTADDAGKLVSVLTTFIEVRAPDAEELARTIAWRRATRCLARDEYAALISIRVVLEGTTEEACLLQKERLEAVQKCGPAALVAPHYYPEDLEKRHGPKTW